MQIAVEKFSEATVGYRDNKEIAEKWVQLFNTNYFMVSAVSTDACFLLSNTLFQNLFNLDYKLIECHIWS